MTNTMTRLVIVAGLGGLALVGCAVGMEPPAKTAMVSVTEGLTFTFGPTDFCSAPGTSGANKPSCTKSDEKIPVIWPNIEVHLEPFAFDVSEVTNFQYEHCVASGGCTEPAAFNAVSTDQQDYYATETFEKHPVVNISWDQAKAYCAWAGKRLPTEYEWERVAAGDPDNTDFPRLYPSDAIGDDVEDCQGGGGFALAGCRNDNRLDAVANASTQDFVTEAGTKVYQLMGNAAEWVSDRYQEDVQCEAYPPCDREQDCASDDFDCITKAKNCPACPYDGVSLPPYDQDACYYMCDDPTHTRRTLLCTPWTSSDQPVDQADLTPSTGGTRSIRGGSVITSEGNLCDARAQYRDGNTDPVRSNPHIGFRCAKDL